MDDPVLTARELVRDRFPAARAAFLAGSVLTDRRTPTSDLSGRSAAFPNRWARQSHPRADELDPATATTQHFDTRAS
ncbi:hypothetical protein ACIHCV_38735 [Streptomyces sp. NPDC051956]|uniref:hypothetical protein n=1 Tax=Streptomyces sp. NPDC051956 TaxID=3365677 RepID=UPI0037D5297A